MGIVSIKAKKVPACAGSWAYVSEAEVATGDGGVVYVMAQEYDTTEITVSKQSLYSFLAEDGEEPAVEFMEEYTEWKDAKASAYADVIAKLKKVLGMLG
jgi:hypothetical protein